MNLQNLQPSYFDRFEDEEIPDQEPYQFIFRDGSKIVLKEFDNVVKVPHSRKCASWTAEEVRDMIELNTWDNYEAMQYIKKNYEQ